MVGKRATTMSVDGSQPSTPSSLTEALGLNVNLDPDDISVSSSEDDESLFSPSDKVLFKSFPRGVSAQPPLINYITNKWETASRESSVSSSSSDSFECARNSWIAFILACLTAPRFLRFMIVYFFLVMCVYIAWDIYLQPMLKERQVLLDSLDISAVDRVGGWYGTNLRPEFENIVSMSTLDSALLPGPGNYWVGRSSQRRLIVVGDVHGCKPELEQLLKEVSFNKTAGDHLIFTGDMISKGPDSAGVVDIAIELGASCVRGNHEDRILLLRADMKRRNELSPGSLFRNETAQSNIAERIIARELSDDQAAWLELCPVILNLGSIKGMGEVVVVHGGLVPGVTLERQELTSVMTMRNVNLETHIPTSSEDGVPWYRLFNQYSKLIASGKKQAGSPSMSTPITVIYGHDASTSLNLRRYTKGLDSGCVYGRKLSALIIEDGGKTRVEQVKCNEYISK